MSRDSEQDTAFDPKRKLCPDGSCVGVIGADGKCTVCETAGTAGSHEQTAEPWRDSDTVQDDSSEAEVTEDSTSSFDPNRRLCSDESCIGVLGPDARCSVCGKPATS